MAKTTPPPIRRGRSTPPPPTREKKTSDLTKAMRGEIRERLPETTKRYRPEVDPDENAAFASPRRETGNAQRVSRASATALERARRAAGATGPEPPAVRGFGEEAEIVEVTRDPDDPDDSADTELAFEYEEEPDERGREEADLPPPLTPREAAQRVRRSTAAAEAAFLGSPAPARPMAPPMRPRQPAQAAPLTDPTILRSTTQPELFLRPVGPVDVDHLWDWIRGDADGGATFLSRTFATSVELQLFIGAIRNAELQHLAAIRALVWDATHFGFLMLAPILADEQTALVHIYLEPDSRGSLGELAAHLLPLAQQLVPTSHLAVYSNGPQWEKLHAQILTPLGFKKHAMFVR